jgi:glycosyltransferase involved in cell wall biosynthesis
MLKIAIPTYNRNSILKENLKLLLPQMSDGCSLLIIDNNSDVPVEESLTDLLKQYSHLKIQIIRNLYNVGLTGNIIKCFELCNEEWLWILGDDDQVTDLSIKTIKKDILSNKNKNFISYAWDEPSHKRPTNIITKGLDELLNSIESIGVILFISTSIYNMKAVSGYLSYGNFFQSTYAPHLAMLFMSLKNDGECILMKNKIVSNEGYKTPIHLRWDQIFIYQLILLLRLPLKTSSLVILRRRLSELTKLWTIEHLIYTLTFMERENEGPSQIVLYNDIVKSFYYLDKRFIKKIIVLFGYIVISNPYFFKRFLMMLFRLLKSKDFIVNQNLRI